MRPKTEQSQAGSVLNAVQKQRGPEAEGRGQRCGSE